MYTLIFHNNNHMVLKPTTFSQNIFHTNTLKGLRNDDIWVHCNKIDLPLHTEAVSIGESEFIMMTHTIQVPQQQNCWLGKDFHWYYGKNYIQYCFNQLNKIQANKHNPL